MKLQSIQYRTNDYDETDELKSIIWSREQVFTASAATETFQFSMTNTARQNLWVSCIYSGPNKEKSFTFVASRIGGPSIGVSSILSSATFGGVGATVTANANGNVVDIDITSGVSGATLTVRAISMA